MTCAGTVTHLGGRSALAEARLTDADGKLFAHATSSCMIFRTAAPRRWAQRGIQAGEPAPGTPPPATASGPGYGPDDSR
jgi:hypothetical protein